MDGQDGSGELIRDWLRQSMPDAAMSILKIAMGTSLPDPQDFDGYVLSGSEKGVYDQTGWMDALRAFLLAAKRAGKPLFGICFGHQIMADTFGGRAEKVPLGVQIGARAFAIGDQRVDAHVWHQDQVTVVPPDATVTGFAPYCPAAVLSYSFPAMSVQFHPEYSGRFLAFEVGMVTGSVLSEAQAAAACESIRAANPAPDLMAAEAARILRGAH